MTPMTCTQLMRRYIKIDPNMSRDFRAVCIADGFSSDQIEMLQHVLDLDNAWADPHDPSVTLDMLGAWKLLVSALRRKNKEDAAMLKDTMDDLRLAMEAKKAEG